MDPLTLLVVADPTTRSLALLEQLPEPTHIVVGDVAEAFAEAAPQADAILHAWGRRETLVEVFRMAPRVRWVHSLTAGVEGILFPELVASEVPLTNSRGVFRRPLAEFAIGAMLFFAKNFRRMVKSQEAGEWDPFDVQEVFGRRLGIIGYGEIGRHTARLAHGFGMKVTALRRRPELSEGDACVEKTLGQDHLTELLAESDYVLVATPLAASTRGLIGERELRAMPPHAVLINVGRGPVVVEEALIVALQEGHIRGAALDVFDQEPLAAGHPFYGLRNVLLSPHCADHTSDWRELAMRFFLENFDQFSRGQQLGNVVDKKLGY
jgi:phosphoglycerate dehydrogenase-like enzyme